MSKVTLNMYTRTSFFICKVGGFAQPRNLRLSQEKAHQLWNLVTNSAVLSNCYSCPGHGPWNPLWEQKGPNRQVMPWTFKEGKMSDGGKTQDVSIRESAGVDKQGCQFYWVDFKLWNLYNHWHLWGKKNPSQLALYWNIPFLSYLSPFLHFLHFLHFLQFTQG